MFGIGHWELLILGLCCATPVAIGAVVALVLAMSNRPPQS